jgi:hypothetical protein
LFFCFLRSDEVFQEQRAISVYEGKRPFSYPRAQNGDKKTTERSTKFQKPNTKEAPGSQGVPLLRKCFFPVVFFLGFAPWSMKEGTFSLRKPDRLRAFERLRQTSKHNERTK